MPQEEQKQHLGRVCLALSTMVLSRLGEPVSVRVASQRRPASRVLPAFPPSCRVGWSCPSGGHTWPPPTPPPAILGL